MRRKAAILLAGVTCLSLSIAQAENQISYLVTRLHKNTSGVNAEHQSNDENDVDITRRIRQALVKDVTLSYLAQNVKIITVDRHVILKGAVRTDEERMKVANHASGIAGMDHVVNEIGVNREF